MTELIAPSIEELRKLAKRAYDATLFGTSQATLALLIEKINDHEANLNSIAISCEDDYTTAELTTILGEQS